MRKLIIFVFLMSVCSIAYAGDMSLEPLMNKVYDSSDDTLKVNISGTATLDDLTTTGTITTDGTVTVGGDAERITGTTHSEYIDFNDNGDDYIRIGGSGGTADHYLDFDLDGDPTILSSSGTLVTGGTNSVYNENLTWDFQTTNNGARLGSTTSANLYMDTNFILKDDMTYAWGTGWDARSIWKTSNVDFDHFQLAIGTGSAAQAGIFTLVDDANKADSDHYPAGFMSNPTLRIYSADGTAPGDYLQFYHDQSDGIVTTGSGNLSLTAQTGEIMFGDDNLTTTGTIATTGTIESLDYELVTSGTVTGFTGIRFGVSPPVEGEIVYYVNGTAVSTINASGEYTDLTP